MRLDAKVAKSYVLTLELDERELNQVLADLDYCLGKGLIDQVLCNIYNEIQEQLGDV